MREIPVGTTTVRSDLENYIKKIRSNPRIQNSLRPQINAQDLNDYLRVNPVDLIRTDRGNKTPRNNIFDFMNRKLKR